MAEIGQREQQSAEGVALTVTMSTSRSTAFHEAHHAAALVIAGMVPKAARTDWPDATTAGSVKVDWGDGIDPDKARAVLQAALLGPLAEGESWDDWPIDLGSVAEDSRRDAEQAATLVNWLKLDRAGFLCEVWRAGQLARKPAFRCLVVAITDELERVEVLDADDLRRIHDRVREESTCST
jgi:hypothetical protein